MIVYIALSVVTLGMAYFVNDQCKVQYGTISRQQMCNRILLVAIFALLAFVSVFRVHVGNDYSDYQIFFYRISRGEYVPTEIGFNKVVYFIRWLLGTEYYMPVFAFFSLGTVYFMIRALYEQSEKFLFSFFLFLMGGYYFSSLNTVRYYFALAIALYSVKYVLKKEYGKFLLWILLAATFHKTVLIVIPIYLLAAIPWKKREIIVMGLAASSLLFFQDFYRKIIFAIYPYYENSHFDNGDISYVNIARAAGVLLLCLLYYKSAIRPFRQNQFYFYLNLGALVLYSVGNFIPETSRIGYYMSVTNVFLIPSVIKNIPNKRQRIFFTVAVAASFVVYFGVFLYQSMDINIRLIPYTNWLFY